MNDVAALRQQGYILDVPYPTFVHRQAMPVWLNMLAQLKGYQSPDLKKPYRYLELGCAMGIHLHLSACANPEGHFVGVDFNAQQLLVAKEGLELTKINNLEIICASFEDFMAQSIEPFDFIVTHGVWSWISAENQAVILKIINKLLKPNGIFYCAYMSHPGATTLTSVQKFMLEASRNLQGDSASKAQQALKIMQELAKTKSGIFEKIPTLDLDIEQMIQDDPNYTAHDFLSNHWNPQHSADMIKQFGQIGLYYAGGASLIENIDALSLPVEVQKIIHKLPLITLKETVKDMARNTLQRQDVYIKNAKAMTQAEANQCYQRLKFGLLPNAFKAGQLKNDPKLGHIQDALPWFEKILQLLKEQDLSIGECLTKLNSALSLQQLIDIFQVLVWAGYIHPCRSSNQVAAFSQSSNKWMQSQQLKWRALDKYGTAVEDA